MNSNDWPCEKVNAPLPSAAAFKSLIGRHVIQFERDWLKCQEQFSSAFFFSVYCVNSKVEDRQIVKLTVLIIVKIVKVT